MEKINRRLERTINRVELEDAHGKELKTKLKKPQPNITPYSKGLYQLVNDFTYNTLGIVVFGGFIYDGASIPKFFWRVIGSPFNPEFQKAALIHDYLYRMQICSRKEADQWLKFYLLESGVSKARAGAMYAAVRSGGLFTWRKKAKNKKKAESIL